MHLLGCMFCPIFSGGLGACGACLRGGVGYQGVCLGGGGGGCWGGLLEGWGALIGVLALGEWPGDLRTCLGDGFG